MFVVQMSTEPVHIDPRAYERETLDQGLASLQEAIDQISNQLRKLRDAYDTDVDFIKELRPRREVLEVITRDGKTPHLRSLIKEVLKGATNGLTSQEIAEALYTYSPHVSFDLFKRRTIVTLSAMNRKENPDVCPVGSGVRGREVRWGLVEEIATAPEGAVTIPEQSEGVTHTIRSDWSGGAD